MAPRRKNTTAASRTTRQASATPVPATSRRGASRAPTPAPAPQSRQSSVLNRASTPAPTRSSTEVSRLKKELTAIKKEKTSMQKELTASTRDVNVLRHEVEHMEHRLKLEESLRRNFMYERLSIEQKVSHERAKHQVERLKLQKEVLDAKAKLAENIDNAVETKFNQVLKKERDMTSFYRKELLEMTGRLVTTLPSDSPSEVWPWQLCEICKNQYKATGKMAPRVLDCGHTFCEGCIGTMRDKKEIECTGCKQITTLQTNDLKKLVLNKLALTM